PVIFVSTTAGAFNLTIQEAAIQAALVSTGIETGTIAFSQLAAIPANAQVYAFKVRETRAHSTVLRVNNATGVNNDPCGALGGTFKGVGTTCTANICNDLTGAC